MAAPARLRAADRDRDRAIDDLRDHYAEGRLDFPEFLARMERAQSATYLDELRPLFVDLPPQTAVRVPRRHGSHPRRHAQRGRPVQPAAALLMGVLLLPLLVLLVLGHVLFPFWLPLLVLWLVLGHRRRRDRYWPAGAPAVRGRGFAPASCES